MANSIDEKIFLISIELFKKLRPLEKIGQENSDLSLTQISLLTLLSTNPGLSLNEIAQRMAFKASSANAQINTLVSLGLVKRQTDPTDRRLVRHQLTRKSQNNLNRIQQTKMREYAWILSELDPAEKQQLLTIIQKIAVIIQDRT
ncbi:MAG TPA: MarR family transcriptional regulator [Candidatus Wirthbacteria bacterium]|nr:MarR family transcriptional regulator [Candidatus Wirthbacteria bacterium]